VRNNKLGYKRVIELDRQYNDVRATYEVKKVNERPKNAVPKCVIKKRLKDFLMHVEGSSYDLKISISSEMPVEVFEEVECSFERYKDRLRYLCDHYVVDLTYVEQTVHMNKEKRYELEIEVDNNLENLMGALCVAVQLAKL